MSESVYRRTDNTMEKYKRTKQRSTKHTYKAKDQVTRTPLKTGDELRYFCHLYRNYYLNVGGIWLKFLLTVNECCSAYVNFDTSFAYESGSKYSGRE